MSIANLKLAFKKLNVQIHLYSKIRVTVLVLQLMDMNIEPEVSNKEHLITDVTPKSRYNGQQENP